MRTKEYTILNLLIKKMKQENKEKCKFNMMSVSLDRKGNIVAFGKNSYCKTHPKMALYNKNYNEFKIFLHSEIDCLIRSKKEPYTLIVARIGKKGEIRIAKPCPVCLEAIKHSTVKQVFFTNSYGSLELLNIQ